MAAVTSQPVESRSDVVVRRGAATVSSSEVRVRRALPRQGPVRCEASSPGTLHGSRLTARGRVVVALVWLALLAVAVLIVMRPSAATADRLGNADTSAVLVSAGGASWQFDSVA